MKILLITDSLDVTSGWGRYSNGLAQHLVQSGDEVTVVCRITYTKLDIPQITGLPNPLNFVRCYLWSWKYAREIVRALKDTDIDCIHCAVEPFSYIAYLISKHLGKPYILTAHGTYSLSTLEQNYFSNLQRTAYQSANCIVCVSNYTKQRILNVMSLQSLMVISNAVDEKDFPIISVSVGRKNQIITVGAVKNRKGQSLVVEALAEVKKTIPDIHYVIVGDQHDDETYVATLKARICSLGMDAHVSFFENVSDKELSALYSSSKTLVLPAVNEGLSFEGFGLVYLEANTFGLPVIGSRGNGAEEAIQDERTGFLVAQTNTRELAQKITLLLSDESLYKKMSENALTYANTMTWTSAIAKYQAEYRSVINGKN